MYSKINNKFIKTIDYSEFVVYSMFCFLIIVTFNLSNTFLALFLFGYVLALICFYIDASNSDSAWMSYISTVFAGLIISLSHNNTLIVFSTCLVITLRLIKSPYKRRNKLLLTLLAYILVGLCINVLTSENLLNNHASTSKLLEIDLLSIVILLTTLLYIMFEFVKIRIVSKEMITDAHQSRERFKKMVRVSNSFSRFVPDQLRNPIVQSAVSTKVFNKRAKLTVFFSDIAGFTKLSDNLDADTLAEILNTYMERMTLVAKKHDAVLDKFIGDGMMCFFGAHGKRTDKQNALACVAMAMDMKREMLDLRRTWRERGFEGLYIRMGINTGYCHVGNFGSENRMSYTVIGKEVNLAARLESVAKPDGIVIGKSTYEYIHQQYKCLGYGQFALKGFDEKVPCWTVCDVETLPSEYKGLYDKNLPGFDLHLDMKEMKNYDYKAIRSHLIDAIEKVDMSEKMDGFLKD